MIEWMQWYGRRENVYTHDAVVPNRHGYNCDRGRLPQFRVHTRSFLLIIINILFRIIIGLLYNLFRL